MDRDSMGRKRLKNPSREVVEGLVSRWSSGRAGVEDETTVVITNDEFVVWSSRPQDIRRLLVRGVGRFEEIEDYGYGLRFVFPVGSLRKSGPSGLLKSEAASEAARKGGRGFACRIRAAQSEDGGEEDGGGTPGVDGGWGGV